MTREEEIRARCEAAKEVYVDGSQEEVAAWAQILCSDIPYLLNENQRLHGVAAAYARVGRHWADSNARLRAELEAAKRDIRAMLQREETCEFCSFCSQNTEHGDCTNDCEKAEWRDLCAENGATP